MKMIATYATFTLLIKFLVLGVADINEALVFISLIALSISFLFFFNRSEYNSLNTKVDKQINDINDLYTKVEQLQSAANIMKFSKEMGAQRNGK